MKPLSKTPMKYLFLIFAISFVIFFPSLFAFYTHDDFFLLTISKAFSLGEFIKFFDFTKGPEGLGVYRPLTTQVFYFLSNSFFNLNPLPLHIISFFVFFATIYLVYKLADLFLKDKNFSLLVAFLYAVSATHFGHLYYLALFQELGLALFFFLSVYLFIKNKHFLSFVAFLLSLLSRETATVLPIVLTGVLFFQKKFKEKYSSLVPYYVLLIVYLYFHFFVYGLAKGESYIWDFSPRIVNTLFWYGLWSLNLPEMLVDFVGSGFKFNPNLFKFWSAEIIPIFSLFGILLALLLFFFVKSFKRLKQKDWRVFAFGFGWFVLTLIPVLFLPLHKFSFYLTLPLFGVVLIIAYLLKKTNFKKFFVFLFLAVWFSLSVFTLALTAKTHWITQGSRTAKNAYDFFERNENEFKGKTVLFYDTSEDEDLPWSPTELLKVVLSDNNFFEIYYDGEISAIYEGEVQGRNLIRIKSRQFLGY